MMNLNDIDRAARDIIASNRLTADNSNRAQRLHCIDVYLDFEPPTDRMTILRILTRIDQLLDDAS